MITLDEYLEWRCEVNKRPGGRQVIEWAQGIQRPRNSCELAEGLALQVLSSGFDYERALKLWNQIVPQLHANQPLRAIKHPNKRRAIETIDREQSRRFSTFQKIPNGSVQAGFDWCEDLPFIRGPVLRYQALRDLGIADVAKPDRHLQRITEQFVEYPEQVDPYQRVQMLCQRLSSLSGDRVGVVDAVLWYAASKNIIKGITRRGHRANRYCRTMGIGPRLRLQVV